MKRRFGEYVRLARGFFGCSSLWRGDGHYLYVKGNGFLLPFSEQYSRFELLKIQSITATRTSRGTVWSVICGMGAVISALLVVASILGVDGSPSDPVLYVLATLLTISSMACLAVISINIVKGPTCVFRIQTAVRGERIRPLSRWRQAQGALTSMQAEIELAQVAALRDAPQQSRAESETLEMEPSDRPPEIPGQS